MKVLLFHQVYKTPDEGGGIRSWYVANALADRGHDVTIITGAKKGNSETGNGSEPGKKGSPRVIRLPIHYSNNYSFPQRILSFLKFLWLARKEAKKLEYDIVYAISVPLTTGLLALWSKKPYIFEVGDLWPDVPVQMGILKNPLIKWYTKRLEKKIYRNADLIISLSPDIQRNIYKKVNSVPNIIVPNFADEQMFGAQENRYRTKDDKRQQLQTILLDSNDKTVLNNQWAVVCSYIGTAGVANDLMQIVQLAKEAKDEHPEFLFCMMIEGMESEKIKMEAPDNMLIIPYGGKDKVGELLSITDFNFVCYAQYSLLGTGSPNKFFDGLAAGCVTVVNVKGWISELIEKTESGLYWNAEDNKGFLESMKDLHEQGLKDMTVRSVELAKQFDKDFLCKKIVKQIEWRFPES